MKELLVPSPAIPLSCCQVSNFTVLYTIDYDVKTYLSITLIKSSVTPTLEIGFREPGAAHLIGRGDLVNL